MANEQQVYRKLNELERELARKDREYEKKTKALADKYKKEMIELEILQQKKLNETEEKVREELTCEINRKEEELASKLDAAERDALERYRQAKQDVEDTRRVLDEAVNHFEDEISQIYSDLQIKEENEKDYANESIFDANRVIDNIKNEPHEAFYPNKLITYTETVKKAAEQVKNNLCQAAIATSVSAKYAATRFLSDVIKMKSLWTQTYEELKKLSEEINAKIDQVEENIKKVNNLENKDCAETEFDFFTKGEFGKFFTEINTINSQIEKCEEAGIKAYLKDKDAMNIDKMNEFITFLKEGNRRIFDLTTVYNVNRNSYDERVQMAEAIMHLFKEELGFAVVENGFEELDRFCAKKEHVVNYISKLQTEPKDQNILGTYEICLKKDDFWVTVGIEPYVPMPEENSDDLNRIRYHVVTGNWAPNRSFEYITEYILRVCDIDSKHVDCVNTKSKKPDNKEISITNASADSMKKLFREQKKSMN